MAESKWQLKAYKHDPQWLCLYENGKHAACINGESNAQLILMLLREEEEATIEEAK